MSHLNHLVANKQTSRLPGVVPTGILSRKPPQLVESSERTPEYPRRTSMDSVSDDQKSVRDDLSEPSSINVS